MNITLTRYKIEADVPESLEFIFISDLHGCDNEPILKIIAENPHDAILIGGDLIHDGNNYRSGLDFLKSVSNNGEICFMSLGNHEKRYPGDIKRVLRNCGATLLDDSYVIFRGIVIAGLTSGEFHGKDPDLTYLKSLTLLDPFKLLLCHRPEYFPKYIKDLPIDLVLSGHAHGGQWRFFGKGLYAPGQGIFPKYASGIYENRLIVGRGLGNGHLIPRINNSPEILVISILPKN